MFDYGIYRNGIYISHVEARNKKDALKIASEYFDNVTVKRIYKDSEIKLWKI